MEKFRSGGTNPENGTKKSDAPPTAERIAQDPGLRQIFLGRAPEVYGNLWRKSGVLQEDIDRNKVELFKTINDPNLLRRTAKDIISVVIFEKPVSP